MIRARSAGATDQDEIEVVLPSLCDLEDDQLAEAKPDGKKTCTTGPEWQPMMKSLVESEIEIAGFLAYLNSVK